MRKYGKGRLGAPVFRRAAVLACLAGSLGLLGGCAGASADAGARSAEQMESLTAEAVIKAGDMAESPSAKAQASGREIQITQAALPEFQAVDETVYVKTREGTPVNVRSGCTVQDASNILGRAANGTALKRTGAGEEWSRVEFNGQTAYVASAYLTGEKPAAVSPAGGSAQAAQGQVALDPSWQYAEFSKINSGAALLYRSEAENRKGKTVCVNAGHGTQGGSSVKTLCHPDGSPKVTGGTTGAGATQAAAVSGGMTFSDGTPEYKVTAALARLLKERLLAEGYDVLMIREGDDVQLDNVARTVIANNAADCHISLHWDSTSSDKGAFYMSVPSNESYRNMEPVKSHWQQHNALGESLVAGLRGAGVKIFSSGSMEMDLTQTSFSTVPSIDIELGDKASGHSDADLAVLASGLTAGVNQFFGE